MALTTSPTVMTIFCRALKKIKCANRKSSALGRRKSRMKRLKGDHPQTLPLIADLGKLDVKVLWALLIMLIYLSYIPHLVSNVASLAEI